MPESKTRKKASQKLRQLSASAKKKEHETKERLKHDRTWVPWVFVPVGLLGVLWMIIFNIAGRTIPLMRSLGDWNMLISLTLIISSFVIATFWK